MYHPSGRLNELYVKLRGDAEETRFVKGITYNARGQRELIEYSDNDARPIKTEYRYYEATFRLTRVSTTRVEQGGASGEVQQIAYVYEWLVRIKLRAMRED